MRVDSSELQLEDHNLWLLDDRLAFFNHFASDKNAASYANVAAKDRPDLAFFYDTCVAWREGENSDTVVLVEFKKPMRDDYTSGRDPVQQILLYVKMLRTERALPDLKGKAIRGVNPSTAFHCYVVADITPTLEERIIGPLHAHSRWRGLLRLQSGPARIRRNCAVRKNPQGCESAKCGVLQDTGHYQRRVEGNKMKMGGQVFLEYAIAKSTSLHGGKHLL
jgi:hypothetical protein